MRSTANSDRFDALDAWRGVAALAVLVYHFILIVKLDELYYTFTLNSYLFVDFFFVLSGFVVCHAYRGRLSNFRQAGGFLLRRVGRLWPLHLTILFTLMLAVVAINIAGHHPDRLMIEADSGSYSMESLLLNLALLNAMGFYGVAWNGPAWSIGAEFYTYILFAVVVLAVGTRRLLPAALALSLTAIATLLMIAPTYMNSTADYGFIRCVAGFFAGVGAYYAYDHLRDMELPFASLWEIAAVILAGAFIVAAGTGPDEVRPLSVAAPLIFALTVLVFARQRGAVSRVLRARGFRALGEWSFSIYLIHMPLLILLSYGLWLYGETSGAPLRVATDVYGHTKQLYDLGHPLAALGLLTAFTAVAVGLAALTYRRVEEPWRDRFARLARNHETGGQTFALLPSRSAGRSQVPARVHRLGRH